jgi:hypothetical protein
VECAFPATELARYVTRLGPLGRVLPEVDEPTKARVLEVVLSALEPYVRGDTVRFNAACWSIGATAGLVA